MYVSGKGGEKDTTKAFELYTKAAEQGQSAAQHNLGISPPSLPLSLSLPFCSSSSISPPHSFCRVYVRYWRWHGSQ
jgi:hypothetical protein